MSCNYIENVLISVNGVHRSVNNVAVGACMTGSILESKAPDGSDWSSLAGYSAKAMCFEYGGQTGAIIQIYDDPDCAGPVASQSGSITISDQTVDMTPDTGTGKTTVCGQATDCPYVAFERSNMGDCGVTKNSPELFILDQCNAAYDQNAKYVCNAGELALVEYADGTSCIQDSGTSTNYNITNGGCSPIQGGDWQYSYQCNDNAQTRPPTANPVTANLPTAQPSESGGSQSSTNVKSRKSSLRVWVPLVVVLASFMSMCTLIQ